MGSRTTTLKENTRPAVRPKTDRLDIRHLALHCSERERAAADAEYRLTRFRQIEFLRQRMDDEFKGVVVAAGKYGLRVEMEGVWVSGTLGVEDLKGEGFRFLKDKHMLVGRRTGHEIRLGDKLKVRVKRADLVTGEVDLVPSGTGKSRRKKGRKASR
jgi:ribonuclease R